MKPNLKIGLAIVGAYLAGIYGGAYITRMQILLNLERNKELMVNCVTSAVAKAIENGWTEEQLRAELDSELEFLKIIS